MESIDSQKMKVARLAIASNITITVGKLCVGLSMGSMGIISDAFHSGLDLIASLISFMAVRQSGKPADENHSYGHGKFENLAGIIESLIILAAAAGIFTGAMDKILHGGAAVQKLGLGMGVMAAAGAVNFIVSNFLIQVGKKTESPALVADGWHLRTDAFSSLAVLAGLVLIAFTGYPMIDPIMAIIVSLIIVRTAFVLIKDSIGSILDASLPVAEKETIITILGSHADKFIEYHSLRGRRAGPYRYVDLHLVVPWYLSVSTAHSLCNIIENEIKQALPRVEVLIHCESCEEILNFHSESCTFLHDPDTGNCCPKERCPLRTAKRKGWFSYFSAGSKTGGRNFDNMS